MFPIASQTVGAGGASSITFSSIPQTFTHLQIRGVHRSDYNSANYGTVDLYMNDTTAGSTIVNLYTHHLRGDGSAVSTYAYGASTKNTIARSTTPAAISTSGIFGAIIVDILDYTNTNKNLVCRSIGGADLNATPGSSWNNGVGINSTLSSRTLGTSSLTFYTDGNFVQYSRFDLYGISTSNATGA